MKQQTVCFTGHRMLAAAERATLERRLEETVSELAAAGYRYFGAGGALGFDTLAAETVLRLREKNKEIKLILVLPCYNQADNWPVADRAKYAYLKAQADKVVYTAKSYHDGCMQVRNRRLVDSSSVCIAYLKHLTGGTAYTVRYARENGLRVINLAENEKGD